METVHIRVRGEHHAVVAQVFDVLLDPERHHHVVQLFVLVDGGAGAAVHVQRLALEGENRLGQHVARPDDRAAGRLPLGNEDRRIGALVAVLQMVLAVLEVRDLDLDPLRRLLGLLLDGIEFGAQLLILGDLGFEEFRRLAVPVQEIDDAGLYLRR